MTTTPIFIKDFNKPEILVNISEVKEIKVLLSDKPVYEQNASIEANFSIKSEGEEADIRWQFSNNTHATKAFEFLQKVLNVQQFDYTPESNTFGRRGEYMKP